MTSKWLCVKHGGTSTSPDSFFLCPSCNSDGINPCECGGQGRYFGEAMFCAVSCDSCKQSVSVIGFVDVRKLWNEGVRGPQG